MITLTLPNHRALSWNMLYKTPHWAYRSLIAQEYHGLVVASLIDAGYNPLTKSHILPYRVDIHFVAHYKGQLVDSDNICGKLYIDGLKGILLTDDNPTYVRRVSGESVGDTQSFLTIQIDKCDSI